MRMGKEFKTSEIIDHYYQLLKNDFKQEHFSLRLILPEILIDIKNHY